MSGRDCQRPVSTRIFSEGLRYVCAFVCVGIVRTLLVWCSGCGLGLRHFFMCCPALCFVVFFLVLPCLSFLLLVGGVIKLHVRACVRACVCVCARVRACVCVCVCVCVCMGGGTISLPSPSVSLLLTGGVSHLPGDPEDENL